MQLTLQDCLDMLDMTPEEVDAVAEHEHVPMVVAAEMAQYLVNEPDGVPRLRRMIVDDIEQADAEHAAKLRAVLRHFVRTHPEAAAKRKARSRRG